MPDRYLLDTNAVIALFADDSDMSTRLQSADETFVSSIVLGELFYGARRSQRVKAFTAASVVLDCDHVTARVYGEIKDNLRQAGRPIPENDIWIAAIASQHNLVLVTRDAHFTGLQGLITEIW